MTGPARSTRHSSPRRITLLAVLTLACVAVLAPAANAARPSGNSGGSSSSTLELVLLDSPDAAPNWGENVTFNVSTTATARPFVQLDCYQGGTRVYGMSAGFYADYPFTKTYTLKSSYWTGGSADCTARLYYTTSKKSVTLKTLSFAAGA